MRFLRNSQNLHMYSHASKFLSNRAGYNRAATEKIFELRIYLYGKDLLHTYTVLTKLSVRTYTTNNFITLVLKKGQVRCLPSPVKSTLTTAQVFDNASGIYASEA